MPPPPQSRRKPLPTLSPKPLPTGGESGPAPTLRKPLPTLLPKPLPPVEESVPALDVADRDPAERPHKRQTTSQACENCRKRKAKCDSTRPQCAACVRRRVDCQYAPPKIDSLVAKYHSVFELLRERSHAESAQALQKIRDSDNLEAAVSSIADARHLLQTAPTSSSSPSMINETVQRPPAPKPSSRGNRRLTSPYDDSKFMFEKQFMVDARDQYVDGDVFVDLPSQNIPLSRWTEVSNDDRLMNHLLRMFWAWDNIVERTLYRPIFEEDVVTKDSLLDAAENPGSFCSRFLVNALLALSCLYTMDVATFKDPGNSVTRGRSWADEADALLAKIEKPSIPLLQGLLALFCYEGNLGSGIKAISHYYLRAMDIYKVLNELDFPQQRAGMDKDRIHREKQAASWCLWGFYCCEWRGTQALGYRKMTRKPRAPRVWREPDFPLSLPNSSGHWWFPYPMSLRVQRSMKVEIREVDAKLSEIVEEALDYIYPAEGEVPPSSNPQRAMELYDAIIDWKLSLPSRLRLEEAVLPSAILLHISAEVILTAILRPFSHMSKEDFGRFDPKERCFAHASSLTSAIWTFRAFSYIRFEYWLTHATSTAGYIVVSEAHDPIHLDTLIRACQCLHEMKVSLPIATDILCGIHAAFKRYKKPVPEHVKKYFSSLHHRKEGLMHHAVAALLPQGSGSGAEVQVQELLSGLDDLKVD